MNNVLELKLKFADKGFSQAASRKMHSKAVVSDKDIERIINDLKSVDKFWKHDNFLEGAIVSIHYKEVVAKTMRVRKLLSCQKHTDPNDSIVGAKFDVYNKKPKHVITYFVDKNIFETQINWLKEAEKILRNDYAGKMDNAKLSSIKEINSVLLSPNEFKNIIIDLSEIEKISVDTVERDIQQPSIVTLYETNLRTDELFNKLKIDNSLNIGRLDGNTILLTPEQFAVLKNNTPYLIAMSVTNLRKLDFESSYFNTRITRDFPKPGIQPVIGVIDTLFDEEVYFSEWVEYKDLVSADFLKTPEDKDHGTMVSSIIVDGAALNPDLDDGCGRFRVRHFGVFAGKSFNSFTVIKKIQEIVANNQDIKVWNLSLGSQAEIDENFVSLEASILDELQYKYDITFVVAGTNKDKFNQLKIGSPADSINSIVVNSVTKNNEPASYSRKGPVLSFYNKPDLSYYGGDCDDKITVYSYDKLLRTGTSFAAPWIARKLCYLIQVMGLTREAAKALLIHSATGWNKQTLPINLIGYGIVPIKIEDILKTPDDEIRFITTGIKQQYDTYFYNLPLPISDDNFPFIAKATMCYFPKCIRNQGVDYTTTDLDLQFGRLTDNPKKKIASINNNTQTEQDSFIFETDARKNFRKWDNIKHYSEEFKDRQRPRKAYPSGKWAISIKSRERLNKKYGIGMKFGLVVSFKEISGKNRIDEFIQLCQFNNILVLPLEINNQVNIYNTAQETLNFD